MDELEALIELIIKLDKHEKTNNLYKMHKEYIKTLCIITIEITVTP